MSRVALVTGGSRGIGLAVVQQLRSAGDRVAVLSRSGDAPEGAFGVVCDVRSAVQVEAAFAAVEERLGTPSVLVHAAGVTADGLVLRTGDDAFADVLDANLTSAYRVTRKALRGMLRQKTGRIVYVGSAVGLLGSPGQTSYAASKAGLIGLSRSLVRELGARDITVNVVAPGPVQTDMLAALPPERVEQIRRQVPLGRTATPEEVAAVVVFLASAAASYVTGAVVPVDGGIGMGH